MADLMADLRAALDEAAEDDQPMRIGANYVHLLRSALNDLDRLSRESSHAHVWQPLGYDRAGATEPARVVQSCSCGEAREVTP